MILKTCESKNARNDAIDGVLHYDMTSVSLQLPKFYCTIRLAACLAAPYIPSASNVISSIMT